MLEEKAIFIPGGHVEIVTNQTILSVRTIDSVDMQVGEKISVDSQAYEIAIIRVNNEGITELVLEKL
jgi:hypothetical protein